MKFLAASYAGAQAPSAGGQPLGKKAQAAIKATSAGIDSDWGSDLQTPMLGKN
jgi:hypothetical protein